MVELLTFKVNLMQNVYFTILSDFRFLIHPWIKVLFIFPSRYFVRYQSVIDI